MHAHGVLFMKESVFLLLSFRSMPMVSACIIDLRMHMRFINAANVTLPFLQAMPQGKKTTEEQMR